MDTWIQYNALYERAGNVGEPARTAVPQYDVYQINHLQHFTKTTQEGQERRKKEAAFYVAQKDKKAEKRRTTGPDVEFSSSSGQNTTLYSIYGNAEPSVKSTNHQSTGSKKRKGKGEEAQEKKRKQRQQSTLPFKK